MKFLEAKRILSEFQDGVALSFLLGMSAESKNLEVFVRAAAAARAIRLTSGRFRSTPWRSISGRLPRENGKSSCSFRGIWLPKLIGDPDSPKLSSSSPSYGIMLDAPGPASQNGPTRRYCSSRRRLLPSWQVVTKPRRSGMSWWELSGHWVAR